MGTRWSASEFLSISPLSPGAVNKLDGRDALLRVRDVNPTRTRSTASLPGQIDRSPGAIDKSNDHKGNHRGLEVGVAISKR